MSSSDNLEKSLLWILVQKIHFYGAFLGKFFITFGANLGVAQLPFYLWKEGLYLMHIFKDIECTRKQC